VIVPIKTFVLVLLSLTAMAFAADDDVDEGFFETNIRPLLIEKCFKCHSGDAVKGGLRLDSRSGFLTGGDTGPAIVAGAPNESLLIQAVRQQGGLEMPPDGKLDEAAIANLARWIENGAPWPESDGTPTPSPQPTESSPAELVAPATFSDEQLHYWAYQPVADPAVPTVANAAWTEKPIDRFVLARMEVNGSSPAPRADKRALLRRVTFDLTGLPPTPEEMQDFLADESPAAFGKVVDRLLESPQYGEHWARHWLDVVRYGETTANDANAVMRYAWRYRNYVIDALNDDVPYDRFLTEQLAGDLLPPSDCLDENTRRVIATGFLMVGPKALAETDKEQSRLDIVDDQIDVVGRAILGMTIACARCHDHKFDAIPTADYYALAGIFRSTEPFQDENRNATMWWEFPVSQGDGREPITVMAPKETTPRNLQIHIRGNRFSLGATAPRGALQIVNRVTGCGEETGFDANLAQSGRLQLARWITNPRNPLTSRVMVNRIWQHHFGRGLVATSDNFGTRGQRPSHPELLDWLASRFVESGWSMKAMHRLILKSSTYQQSVTGSRDDELLCGFQRRRLSAEEVRDAVLAVSGALDRNQGTDESGEFLYREAEDIKAGIRPNRVGADHPFYSEFTKRSVYLPIVRNLLPDVLALFDGADPNGVTAIRNETTVPSQALFLLNSPFMREQSRRFALRVLALEMPDEQRLEHANLLAFGRPLTDMELEDAKQFLARYEAAPEVQSQPECERRQRAWQSYCQILLCENEFFYVE